MHLNSLQITAPFPSANKAPELTARIARVAAAYSVAAFAGAFLVVLMAMLLQVQESGAVPVLPLLRALSAIAVVFAFGFLLGRIRQHLSR